MPASFGVHGPGDSTIASGFFASTSSAVILSLRILRTSRTQLAQEVDEVVGEAVVVIDEDEHGCLCVPPRRAPDMLAQGVGSAPEASSQARRGDELASLPAPRAMSAHFCASKVKTASAPVGNFSAINS